MLVAVVLVASGCGGYTEVGSDISSGSDNGGTGVSSLFSSPSELGVGDFMIVGFDSVTDAALDFTGVDTDAKFVLAVGNASETGSSATIGMQGSVSLPDPVSEGKEMSAGSVMSEDDGYEVNEIFSAWLHASEHVLQESEVIADVAESSGNFKGMSAKAVGADGNETFRVLSSLSNTNAYVNVTGRVACEGDNIVVYVDTTVPSDVLGEADVAMLCNDFDGDAGEMFGFLGSTSDVDSDGKVHVLMTSQINKLGAMGGGIITGYFYAADLYARSESNPVSNEREIIYTMVPDPSGRYGMAVEQDFAIDNLIPAVLPHELQHAINYNQHVLVRGGVPEENWLNEGESHLIEDVMRRGSENPSRYALYLASPSTYGIVTQYSPNLMERGGAYLFLRYLYEQSTDGKAFLGRLEQTSLRGVENVIEAFQGDASMDGWSEMLARWSAALILSSNGASSDPRYTYRDRVYHAETGNWEGVVLQGAAEDGRGTVLNGVNINTYTGSNSSNVDGSTAKYYDISSAPDQIGLTASSLGANYAVLVRYQ
jgi:hypothetical protein